MYSTVWDYRTGSSNTRCNITLKWYINSNKRPPLQCSFADCVNYKKSQEPFYLHPPSPVDGHHHQQQHQQQPQHNGTGRGKVAVKDGLYVVNTPPPAQQQQQQQHQQFCKVNAAPVALHTVEPVRPQPQGPFYLHNPNGVIDDPVKDIIFATEKTAAKTAAYVIAAGPPPPPLPAIGLNTMTGKTRSIILLLTPKCYIILIF